MKWIDEVDMLVNIQAIIGGAITTKLQRQNMKEKKNKKKGKIGERLI